MLNGEMNIPGYNILTSDRNRHGGGDLCYIKNTICYNRNSWFHKKCELPNNPVKFKELKNTVNPIYICKACSNNVDVQNHSHQNQNPLESLPFVDEDNFEDIFGPNETAQNLYNKPEDAEDDPDYNVFKKRGLHFVHINANSIL